MTEKVSARLRATCASLSNYGENYTPSISSMFALGRGSEGAEASHPRGLSGETHDTQAAAESVRCV